jgi:hypothetical protein
MIEVSRRRQRGTREEWGGGGGGGRRNVEAVPVHILTHLLQYSVEK